MGLFQKIREKREKRRQMAELKRMVKVFDDIGTLFEKRLMLFDTDKHQLFIHHSLANVMLAKGADAWMEFLKNVYLCLAYEIMTGRWEEYFRSREQKALAKAWEEQGELSTADVERIKRAARAGVTKDKQGNDLPMEFEFVIIYDRGITADIVAVGHYDAQREELEMEEWSWVKHMVEQENKKPTYGTTIRTRQS